MISARGPSEQQGFSLVELMVALTVGLLLLAGVLQILLANRRSFDAQRGTAHLQENVRLADFVLQHSIAHAGYRADLTATTDGLFPGAPATGTAPAFVSGAVVSGTYGGTGGNDTLRIRFQSSGGVRNCRGEEIGSPSQPAMADFVFRVSADGTSLLCEQVGGDTQPIADDVDRFKVRYGLDTDGVNGVDLYTSTITAAQSVQVRSIRVQLLLHSSAADGDAQLPTPLAQSYTFSDQGQFGITDRRVRVMLDQTIALRNLLP